MPEPHARAEPENRDAEGPSPARNARYGLRLFGLYVILYAGFMALAAFSPRLMAGAPWGGTNLAILYGFGLIVSALILACVYMVLCGRRTGSRP